MQDDPNGHSKEVVTFQEWLTSSFRQYFFKASSLFSAFFLIFLFNIQIWNTNILLNKLSETFLKSQIKNLQIYDYSRVQSDLNSFVQSDLVSNATVLDATGAVIASSPASILSPGKSDSRFLISKGRLRSVYLSSIGFELIFSYNVFASGNENEITNFLDLKIPIMSLLATPLLATMILILAILMIGLYFRARIFHFTARLAAPIHDFAADLSKLENFDSFIVSTPNFSFVEVEMLRSSFRGLFLKLKESEDLRSKVERQAERSKIATQVAHDIRSPLSALTMIMATLNDVPEEKRLLIRSSVQRINDIANDLLRRSKDRSKPHTSEEQSNPKLKFESQIKALDHKEFENKRSLEFIPALIDVMISEKRMQYREHSGISIDVDLRDSFGAFSKVNSAELKRVISNLVNNSVEAFDKNQGSVVVGVRREKSHLEIFVSDNGKGIPPEVLNELGEMGVTHGKTTQDSVDQGAAVALESDAGHGIGIYHAKKTINAFGGDFEIESSIGQGTTIRMRLPLAAAPSWFADRIDLTGKKSLVSLDDDVTIHQIWSGRLSSLGFSKMDHQKIQSGDVFKDHVRAIQNGKDSKAFDIASTLFLVDFELLNQAKTGLDLIEELGIEKQSILVTSRYEEGSIQERAEKIGLKILPKSLSGFVPILCEEPKLKYDAILVDDDSLVQMAWKMSAATKSKNIATFTSGQELKAALPTLDRENVFYIDSNLSNFEKGEDLAKKLFELGCKNIYLATGYEADQFKHVTWVKGVVGKEFPS